MAQSTISRPRSAAEFAVPEGRVDYATYEAWFDLDAGRIGEWVDGEVVLFVPPDDRHHLLASWLTSLLTLFTVAKKLGAVWSTPFEIRRDANSDAREPDIVFLKTEHFHRRDGKRIIGPADLVVEIVSEDSVRRDRRDKHAQYAEWGIPEYWLIDPRPGKQVLLAYTLASEGYFEAIPAAANGWIASVILPGFRLRPEMVFADPLLDPNAALLEIDPVGYRAHLEALLGRNERPIT